MNRSDAPWTDDEVASLNGFQQCGYYHPFTGKRKPNGAETILIATRDGWIEEPGGPVVQKWAHAFMADGSWKRDEMSTILGTEDTDPGA